jgi:DNA (cytosine-5)-methyltransferase 1
MNLRHGSLFSGIGGFDLAAEWAGWTNVFNCEIDLFCRKVLKYYWPEVKSFRNIIKADFKQYEGKIDIISGGFPCQPFSIAGKRKGTEDYRNLWPEMFKAIQLFKSTWVVGENVFGIANWDGGLVFEQVQLDLEAEGYEVQTFVLPACAVDAPHRRDRVWFVAYSGGCRQQRRNKGMQSSLKQGYDKENMFTRELQRSEWTNSLPRPRIFRNDDGLSKRLVNITISKHRNESIKAYGNAIVPQVAYQIFKAINEYEKI